MSDVNQFRLYNALNNKSVIYEHVSRRISTGKRVLSAADDTSSFSVINSIKSKNSIRESVVNNLQSGIDLLRTSESSLDGIEDIIGKIRNTIHTSSGSDNTEISRKEITGPLLKDYIREIESMGKKVKFNNTNLLDGSLKLNLKVGLDDDSYKKIELPKITSTSLGGTINGTKAYQIVNFDGAVFSAAKRVSAPGGIPERIIGDQTVTVKADGETIKFQLTNDGNVSLSDVIQKVKEKNIDGIRETTDNSELYFDPIDSTLHTTEGDLIEFEIYSGNVSKKISFIAEGNIKAGDYSEINNNYKESIQNAIAEINQDNLDLDLEFDGTKLVSKSGKDLTVGNLKITDNPSIAIGNFDDTPPGSKITLDIDGLTISFTKGYSATQDMNSFYNALNSVLRNPNNSANKILTYPLDQTGTMDTVPPMADYYTLRKDTATNSVVISKNSNSPIEVKSIENYRTSVTAKNFDGPVNEVVKIEINNTPIYYLSNGSDDYDTAAFLASSINNNSTLRNQGVSASTNGTQVIINSDKNPDTSNTISVSNYKEAINSVSIDNFDIPKGETVNMLIDGKVISFKGGDTSNQSAYNLYAALRMSSSFSSDYSAFYDDGKIIIAKHDDTEIEISQYKNEANKAVFNDFNFGKYAEVSFKIDGELISFNSGANNAEAAANLLSALQSSNLDSNEYYFSKSYNEVYIDKNDLSDIQLTDYNFMPGYSSFDIGYNTMQANYADWPNYFFVDGTEIEFIIGNTEEETRNNIISSLNNSSLDTSKYQWNIVNDKVNIMKQGTPPMQIEGYSKDNSPKAVIKDFVNQDGQLIIIDINGQRVSFIGKGIDDQAANALALYNSLNSEPIRSNLLNDGTTVSLENDKVILNNSYYYRALDIAGYSGGSYSFSVEPWSNSFGGGLVDAGNSARVDNKDSSFYIYEDNRSYYLPDYEDPIELEGIVNVEESSFSFNAYTGSTGTNEISYQNKTGSISDIATSMYITASPSSTIGSGISSLGDELDREATVSSVDQNTDSNFDVAAGEGSTNTGQTEINRSTWANITESQGTVIVDVLNNSDGGSILSNDGSLIESNQSKIVTATADNFDNVADRKLFVYGRAGDLLSLGDNQNDWAVVEAVRKLYLDANIDFEFSSDKAGDYQSGGVFNVASNQKAELEYKTTSTKTNLAIDNFNFQEGTTVDFKIEDNSVSFSPTDVNNQQLIAQELLTALNNQASNLKLHGYEFRLNGERNGVLITSTDSEINVSSFQSTNDEEFMDITNTDGTDLERKGELNYKNMDGSYVMARFGKGEVSVSDASFKTFIPISQLDFTTKDGLVTAMSIMEQANNQIMNAYSLLGDYINQLERREDTITTNLFQGQKSLSRIEDADAALESMENIKSQISIQVSTKMLSQLMQLSKEKVLSLMNNK